MGEMSTPAFGCPGVANIDDPRKSGVINISSIADWVAHAGRQVFAASYNASKGALITLTRR